MVSKRAMCPNNMRYMFAFYVYELVQKRPVFHGNMPTGMRFAAMLSMAFKRAMHARRMLTKGVSIRFAIPHQPFIRKAAFPSGKAVSYAHPQTRLCCPASNIFYLCVDPCPRLVPVARFVPKNVICRIWALSFDPTVLRTGGCSARCIQWTAVCRP